MRRSVIRFAAAAAAVLFARYHSDLTLNDGGAMYVLYSITMRIGSVPPAAQRVIVYSSRALMSACS